MMRSYGAGLIWLSLTLIGIVLATRLKKKTAFFSSVVNFMKSLSVEIEYSMSDLPSLIMKISETDLCKDLSFLKSCTFLLQDGIDFPRAWETSVKEDTVYMSNIQRDKLMSMGMSLGTTHLQGQKKIIGLFTEYFESYYHTAKGREEKYYRIYIMTGILSGFGVFILLI